MPALWEMESRTVDEMICPLDRPFELKGRKKWLINVGSVGQPRDGDVRACYVIFQPAQRRVEFRRVSYDLASVTKAILDSGLPRSLAERLVVGC
jgi:diadenosine tetraphosphatase ApaH/serine/threonine PP2A family protein phosphatase